MRNGTCLKCGGTEIYRNFGTRVYHVYREAIHIGGLSDAHTTAYICAGCGYFEEYVEDTENLEKIKKKWEKI